MKTKTFITLGASLMIAGSASAANLLVNAGFETDAAGTTPPTGWSIVGAADQVKDSTGGLDGLSPQEGAKMFQLQDTSGAVKESGISQTFTVATTGDYVMSGWFAPRDNVFGSNDYTFTLTNSTSTLVVADDSSDPTLTAGDWNEITRTYNGLVAGTYTVAFVNTGTANLLQGTVDNFSFDTASAGVPEPSSTALLGLGGLALILRRRK